MHSADFSPFKIYCHHQQIPIIRIHMAQSLPLHSPLEPFQATVLDIYSLFKQHDFTHSQSKHAHEDLVPCKSEQYLSQCRQIPAQIHQMLLYIQTQSQILLGKNQSELPTSRSFTSNGEESEKALRETVAEKEMEIERLMQEAKETQHKAKMVQMKLLNSVKRLSIQIQQKQCETNQLKDLLSSKVEEVEELLLLNDKKYRTIRKLEEDLYDAKQAMERLQDDLEMERNCSILLQKKLSRVEAKKQENLNEKRMEFVEAAIQTESSEAAEDELEGRSASLGSRYMESIDQLKMELGEAYERISELTGPAVKAKTKSGYFGTVLK